MSEPARSQPAGRDPRVEHEATRAALREAIARLVRLLRDLPDLDAPAGVPAWSVGDVGAHLCGVYLAFGAAFVPEGPDTLSAADWDRLLVASDGDLLADRIAVINARALELVGSGERARLADIIAERGEAFLRATADLPPDTAVSTPWYGDGVELTLAAVTGLMLNESVLHGLDIATGARRDWTIAPAAARLVLSQAIPSMMPLALDTEKARGVDVAYELAISGGPTLVVAIEDGAVTVTRDAPPRRCDCRIIAQPTAFLLVSFGRAPLWKMIMQGRIRAGGRKPWLAPRLRELVVSA